MSHKNTPPRPVLSTNEITIVALGYAEPDLVDLAYADGLTRDALAERGLEPGAFEACDEHVDGVPTPKATAYSRLIKRMGAQRPALDQFAPIDQERILSVA